MTDNSPGTPEAAGSKHPVAGSTADGTGTSGDGGRRRKRSTCLLIMAAAGLFAYAFDQVTKLWVVATMTEGQITEVLPPVLSWHFIRNSGAAFSIGEDVTWIFTIIQAAVPLIVFWLSRRLGSFWWSIAFGLLAGGALGNLTDRLFREPSFGMGHVVDFIAFPNFAIFNIADSAVVGAVILICILTFKGIGLDGQPVTEEDNGGRRGGKRSARANPDGAHDSDGHGSPGGK
ncbi:signal peptidase II [Arthrobacter sp. H14]|uniref:signal peptidase II n=1 Tax=Arthrobacter sp. H14 TaxID=1312959 RepID=UPI0004B0D3A0|nr:signal peptidase II [Arthrobacter sp. H14]